MKGRLFARWKPPRGRWSKEEPSLRGRWPKEAAPLRGRRKAEEGTPWEKGRSFFAPKSNRRTRSRHIWPSSPPVYRRKDVCALKKRRLFAQWKPPARKTVGGGSFPTRKTVGGGSSLARRRLKEAAPLRGRRKTEKGTSRRKDAPSFFVSGSDGRTRSRLLGGLPRRLIRETARTYERALAPHLAFFPAGLSEKRRPNFSLPSFLPLSARNARRRGQKCPFLPECAGDMVENEPFSRNTRAIWSKMSLSLGTRRRHTPK